MVGRKDGDEEKQFVREGGGSRVSCDGKEQLEEMG